MTDPDRAGHIAAITIGFIAVGFVAFLAAMAAYLIYGAVV